jgi:hypoxanthine phosphoribosyltransferase
MSYPPPLMHRDIERILIDERQIAARVRELGTQIAGDLTRELGPQVEQEGRIVIIPIMTGAMVFVADLIRHLPLKLSLELVAVSSYPGKSMESKGVAMRSELPRDLRDRHVLVIDDILDSGQTLRTVADLIGEQRPASLRMAVLLRKPGKAKVAIQPDYVGFDIPDEFVVGYGLDYNGFYRNFPQIATLRAEAR